VVWPGALKGLFTLETQSSNHTEHQAAVRAAVLGEHFLRATFSGKTAPIAAGWIRVTLRPVEIRGARLIQFAYFDERRCITKNYAGADLATHLDELLATPFKNVNVATTEGDIQVEIGKSGASKLHRSKTVRVEAAAPAVHDRQKDLLLPEGKPDPYLQAIGFMTSDGRIKAERQRKFRQINEFLRLLLEVGEFDPARTEPLEVVDCGCGNAYLTFAAYHYLTHVLGIKARMTGVDLRGDLLEKHAETARALSWTDVAFVKSAIADYQPAAPPTLTFALHACDTATDEAIAGGIAWKSRVIISVPCCHHNLQEQIKHPPEMFRPLYRHGILAERMGDLLTDTFRAQILRIAGYRTEVLQFVSPEHTARNLMIRAVRTDQPAPPEFLEEYRCLKEYWGVTPYLETLLAGRSPLRLE
jgi:SAM-dependent methyltransferase